MVDRYNYTSHRNEYCENSSNQYSSFSSTLLDAVYRSIDQGEEENLTYKETMRKKQSSAANVHGGFKTEEAMANFQRVCMIEKWMEKKASEKIVGRSNSVTDLQKKVKSRRNHSSSGSSDSSCGGGFFSSSEAESFPVQRLKPVRTGFEKEKLSKNLRDFVDPLEQKPKDEGKFLMTKSRALKIYGNLKKVKQPISPGGKLAGFLNSIFTTARKPKIVNESPSLKSTNTSTCSSASSFSRSCLSKTPSYVLEKNRRVEEVARDLLRNYQKNTRVFDEELEDDDDAASYASSDLFELDNLSSIGMERYSEELPVYETTYLDTNRAIANGLML